MFRLFKNKPKPLPAFEALKAYENRDKYFYRTAEWLWHNSDQITIIDPVRPRILTLDPWPQLVYLAADGQKTVSQFVSDTANEYTGEVPEQLDETIIYQLQSLLEEGILTLSDSPYKPEDRILYPKQ